MKDTLDSITVLMTGSGSFDQATYDLFISSFDEKLIQTQERQWEGMAEYAQMGGDQSIGDLWPKCEVSYGQEVVKYRTKILTLLTGEQVL